jgi:hypothetical protein
VMTGGASGPERMTHGIVDVATREAQIASQ